MTWKTTDLHNIAQSRTPPAPVADTDDTNAAWRELQPVLGVAVELLRAFVRAREAHLLFFRVVRLTLLASTCTTVVLLALVPGTPWPFLPLGITFVAGLANMSLSGAKVRSLDAVEVFMTRAVEGSIRRFARDPSLSTANALANEMRAILLVHSRVSGTRAG